MDLKDLTPKSDTVTIKLKHPGNGEELKNEDGSVMTLVMYAPHSKVYKKHLHEQVNKRIKEGKTEVDLLIAEEAAVDLMSSTVKAWNITYDGVKPKLSKKKALEIFDKLFWVKAQVEEAFEELVAFMKV